MKTTGNSHTVRHVAGAVLYALATVLVLALLTEATSAQLVLNRAGATGEYTAPTTVTLSPGFQSTGNFRASIAAAAPALGLGGSTNQNYVQRTVYLRGFGDAPPAAGALTVADALRDITYHDGLGRPVQELGVKAAPNQRDVAVPIVYDSYGRQHRDYLPYATATGAGGAFKANAAAQQAAYYNSPPAGVVKIDAVTGYGTPSFGERRYEASPLGRVLEQGFPGGAWQPGSRTATGGRTAVAEYAANDAVAGFGANSRRVARYGVTLSAQGTPTLALASNAIYGAGELYVAVTKDENWVPADGRSGTGEEYTDKQGRVVLKRAYNGSAVVSTYYVYNDFGQLAFVLTPGSSPDRGSLPAAGTARNAWLSDHVYQYKYDQRGRLVEKKVPGKGREFLVYNRLDQVVATQDSVQRGKSPQQWTAVKYDAHGRVVRKVQWRHQGSTANGDRRTAVQDSAYLITGANQWEERNAAGTAYTNRSWPRGNTAVLTEQFYDDYDVAGLPAAYKRTDYSAMTKGLPTVSRVQVLGTTQYLWSAVYYDDRGNAVREYRQHYKGGGTAGANNYDDVATEYSFTRQALASTRRHYASGSLSATVKTEHAYDHRERLADTWKSVDGGTRTLVSRNVYNELGQLYRRQLHSTNGTSFAETVTYGYNARGWLLKAVSPKFQQTLLYEDTTAVAMRQFNGNISRQGWRHGTGTVQGYAYTYDRLGRLLSGVSGSRNETAVYDAMGNIRSLSHDGAAMAYEYSPLGSNRLDRITGVGTAYAYDGNGNMTRDGRQNLSVAYNELNLPVSVGTSAAYTYDATGRKLRSEVSGTATDYIDGIEWEGGTLNLIRMEEGRMVKSGGNYVYDYMLRDHLGNTRSGFSSDATGVAKFVTDYYPFGRSHSGGATTSPKNRYLYNGKELQEVSGYYDYGARFYDPVIGRWGSVDPLAEKHFNLTPYNYVLNNPLIYIDPFGLDTLLYNQDTGKLLDRKLGEGKSAIYTVSGDYDEENIWGSASPLVYQVGQRSGGVSGKSFRNNHPLKGIGTQVGGQVYLEDLLDMTSEFNTLIADKMGLFESLNDYSSSWGYISPKFLVFKDWVTDNGPFDLKSLKRSNETSYAAIVIGEWSILNGELRRYDDYGNMSYGAWGRSAGFTTKDLIRGSNLNQIWKGMFGKTNMGGDETRDVNMILRGIREFR